MFNIVVTQIALERKGLRCGTGIYSVNTAYKALFTLLHGTLQEPIFERIWHIKVPPKVNIFLWRMMRNRFPTGDNLKVRNLDIRDVISHILFAELWSKLFIYDY